MSVGAGDVIRIYTPLAGKKKYLLCVGVANGSFLMLNSWKGKDFEGNIKLPCSEIDFLAPTGSGYSVICCSKVLTLSDAELAKAEHMGRIKLSLMRMVFVEAENSDVLSDIERQAIIDGLGDFL